MKKGLTYGDVLIVPKYSDITTREDIDVRSEYFGRKRLPIISAPMDTVSGPKLVAAMARGNAYGILHRFDNTESLVVGALGHNLATDISISVGVKNWDKTAQLLERLLPYPIHSICIDVAHGHHLLVAETIANIRYFYETQERETPFIIAGNVATADGYEDLAVWGADAIRVGIGPGSACTTRETTGVGYPQLSAIRDIVTRRDYLADVGPIIIADGGIQNPGDIAKALAAGADAVMLGKMLAGTDESPGEVWQNYKRYAGQSISGSNGSRGAPEGISGWVPTVGPLSDLLSKLEHYLKSSFSYVGASNLQEFRDFAEFIRVSPATYQESGTRL